MVTISHDTKFSITMPSGDEAAELLSIARSSLFPRAPRLSDIESSQFFAQFILAFGFLTTVKRTPGLRDRLDTWLVRASNWSADRNAEQPSIGPSEFLCAAAAHGDICYQYDAARWPFDIRLGLSWSEGVPASAAGWQAVLASRKVRASVPATVSLYPSEQPVRITQLDMLQGHNAKPFG